MPYATIYLAGAKQSPESKRRLQALTTDALVDVLGSERRIVAVRLVEEAGENWAVAGQPLAAGGAMMVVSIIESAVDAQRMAEAIRVLANMLKDVLGGNALPPYVVFDLVPDHAWGYKGRTVAALKAPG